MMLGPRSAKDDLTIPGPLTYKDQPVKFGFLSFKGQLATSPDPQGQLARPGP